MLAMLACAYGYHFSHSCLLKGPSFFLRRPADVRSTLGGLRLRPAEVRRFLHLRTSMDVDGDGGWGSVASPADAAPEDGWADVACADAEQSDDCDAGWGSVVDAPVEAEGEAGGWGSVSEDGLSPAGDSEDEAQCVNTAIVAAAAPSQAAQDASLAMVVHQPAQTLDIVLRDVKLRLGDAPADFGSVELGRCAAALAAFPEDSAVFGKRMFEPSSLELARKLGLDSHVRSTTSIAADANAEFKKTSAMRLRLGAAAFHIERYRVVRMLESLSEQVLASGGDCLTISLRFRYDETPLKLKVVSKEPVAEGEVNAATHVCLPTAASLVEESSSSTKLVQIEIKGSALFRLGGQYHTSTFSMPSNLAVVDRCTGAAYKSLLHRSCPDMAQLEGRFRRSERLSTTDGDKACCLAERAIAHEERHKSHGHSLCEIHRIALLAKKAYRLMSFELSGLVNIALSLRVPGGMRAFRQILRRVLSERTVRLTQGSPGQRADLSREAVLGMFAPVSGGSLGSLTRRLVISKLANGNYENMAEVEHYCSGCCSSREETVAKMVTVYTRAVAGFDSRLLEALLLVTLPVPTFPRRVYRQS